VVTSGAKTRFTKTTAKQVEETDDEEESTSGTVKIQEKGKKKAH
jgi:hypothetical protein